MNIQTTRGCPFNCEFCDIIALFGRIPRHKTIQQVLAEIDIAYRLGAKRIVFSDDNFIGSRKYAEDLLQSLIHYQNQKGKSRLSFETQVSINLAEDENILELMRQVGMTRGLVGIETPSEKALTHVNKKVNIRYNLIHAIQKIHAHGIQVVAGMIVGFDQDGPEIFEQHFQFLQKAIAISF